MDVWEYPYDKGWWLRKCENSYNDPLLSCMIQLKPCPINKLPWNTVLIISKTFTEMMKVQSLRFFQHASL